MSIRNAVRRLLPVFACLALVPALATAQGTRGIQGIRPLGRQGLNVFEDPKQDTIGYRGLTLAIGAGFAQEFQNLSHNSASEPNLVNGVNANVLPGMGPGFNTAMANMYMNVQMARGIRVALTSYLSSRNHNETWVKDGYILIDDSPWDVPLLKAIMKNATLKVGHFEVNYGDAHFRRTDGGNSLYNPFVGNMVLDGMTTEIGGELYLRAGPWMAMGGITGSESKGHVDAASGRAPAYLSKLGFDQQITPMLRARLTGSSYFTARSLKNTLFTGDRAGTHYVDVMDATTNNWSGNVVPMFSSNVRSFVVNPFVKYGDLELFGNIETATGGSSTEYDRTWRQQAIDGVYRLFSEKAYVATRYNVARGSLPGFSSDVGQTRVQLGGGVFITDNILGKVEYVRQTYQDFPVKDLRYGADFKGLMFQGAVLF